MNIKRINKYFFPVILVLFAVAACQDDPIIEDNGPGSGNNNPKSRAFITYVQLSEFPVTDISGNSWDTPDTAVTDTFGRADIFFNITDPSPDPPVLWSQNSHFSDVTEDDTTVYVLLNQYEVIPFGSSIDVNIYDYELPDSTLMETINFTIDAVPDPVTPYPDAFVKSQNGYTVVIGVRWEE